MYVYVYKDIRILDKLLVHLYTEVVILYFICLSYWLCYILYNKIKINLKCNYIQKYTYTLKHILYKDNYVICASDMKRYRVFNKNCL